MRKKFLEMQQKIGAQFVCRKAVAKDKILAQKDPGFSVVVLSIVILCIGILLAIVSQGAMEDIIDTLSGKAQSQVTKQFG